MWAIERHMHLNTIKVIGGTQLHLLDIGRGPSFQPDRLPDPTTGSKSTTVVIVTWPTSLFPMRDRQLIQRSLHAHNQLARPINQRLRDIKREWQISTRMLADPTSIQPGLAAIMHRS